MSTLKTWQRPASEETGNHHITEFFAKRQYEVSMMTSNKLLHAHHEAQKGEQNFQDGATWRYKVANAEREMRVVYEMLKGYFHGN